MNRHLAPRRARDLRPAEMRVKAGPSVPKLHDPTKRWPRDLPRMMGGKAMRFPSVRAPIKGLRKLERLLNPKPKMAKLPAFAGCLRFVTPLS